MEDWQAMKEVIAAVRRAIRDAASQPPSGLFFATLRTASKPSSAQTSAKSRIKLEKRLSECLTVFQPDCRFGPAAIG
jgi:hypothetical protein